MNRCCVCLEKTEALYKLKQFRADAVICSSCRVTHFKIIESGDEIVTKHYDFVKKVNENLKTIKKMG